MLKLCLYFGGIILISLGICFTIIDANLLTMGYSFFDFVNFISRRIEIYFIIIGIIFLSFALERWKKK